MTQASLSVPGLARHLHRRPWRQIPTLPVAYDGPVERGVEAGDEDPSLLDARLSVPDYHRVLREHFETTEPELWRWFAEARQLSAEAIGGAELELLKTSYRLDGDQHAALAGIAQVVAGKLGIEHEVVLYQALHGEERNARVVVLGDRIHIVFSGDLLDLLTVDEQEVVLAHELAHAHLFERDGGAYGTLDHMVHRMDVEAAASDAVGETARRLRLHTEVYADAAALAMTDNQLAVVATIVKVSTGMRQVDPEAYLRQAREIVEADSSASNGWTHPELHVRTACVAARASDASDRIVTQLIEGPDDLDHIDLIGQLRLQALTARVLSAGVQLDGRAEASLAYVRNYPELAIVDGLANATVLAADELTNCTPSVRHLCAALLADFALIDDDVATGLDRIGAYAKEATRIGVGNEFDKIVARATERTLADMRALRSR